MQVDAGVWRSVHYHEVCHCHHLQAKRLGEQFLPPYTVAVCSAAEPDVARVGKRNQDQAIRVSELHLQQVTSPFLASFHLPLQ